MKIDTGLTTETCDPIARGVVTARDQVLAIFALEVLSDYPGLPGLFVVGVFSASLSSVSSGLNSLAAVVLRDCINVFWTLEPQTEAKAAKVMSFAFGIGSIGFAFVVGLLPMLIQVHFMNRTYARIDLITVRKL